MDQTNTFNEEGRISQIEFAIKNVSRAGTSVGMKCTDGTIFIGLTKKVQDHIEKRNEKIYKLTKNIFCILSGVFGDGLQIISIARIIAQKHLNRFNEEIKLKHLVETLGNRMQYFTQNNNLRPFGVSFLFASKTENKLMSCNPAGSVNEWTSKAFGTKEDSINTELSNIKSDLDMKQGIFECFRILSLKQEIVPKNAGFYEVFMLNEQSSTFMKEEEVREIVTRVKEQSKENDEQP